MLSYARLVPKLDKITPRVLQPSPLKRIMSRDSERKDSREEKHITHLSILVIA
jgi:hypothetical protein